MQKSIVGHLAVIFLKAISLYFILSGHKIFKDKSNVFNLLNKAPLTSEQTKLLVDALMAATFFTSSSCQAQKY